MFGRFKFLLICWPVAEIALFIVIGGRIGIWAVLGAILLSAVLGGLLISRQNTQAMSALRSGTIQLSAPDLAHGVMFMVAGILLLLPGFLTDFIGLSLLSPFVRTAIFRAIMPRTQSAQTRDDIIDAEYVDVTDQSRH